MLPPISCFSEDSAGDAVSAISIGLSASMAKALGQSSEFSHHISISVHTLLLFNIIYFSDPLIYLAIADTLMEIVGSLRITSTASRELSSPNKGALAAALHTIQELSHDMLETDLTGKCLFDSSILSSSLYLTSVFYVFGVTRCCECWCWPPPKCSAGHRFCVHCDRCCLHPYG